MKKVKPQKSYMQVGYTNTQVEDLDEVRIQRPLEGYVVYEQASVTSGVSTGAHLRAASSDDKATAPASKATSKKKGALPPNRFRLDPHTVGVKDDAVKPRPFNKSSVMQPSGSENETEQIRIEFEGTVTTLEDFWKRVVEDASYTDEILQWTEDYEPLRRVRIMKPSNDAFSQPIYMFKFTISLFGSTWTVYKSEGQVYRRHGHRPSQNHRHRHSQRNVECDQPLHPAV